MLPVNKPLAPAAPCPCQSGENYGNCCAPYHNSARTAPTPEALMRSRFSAYALDLRAYLINTWTPQTRPKHLPPPSLHWVGLSILDAPDPEKTPTPDHGAVHFRAIHRQGDNWGFLEERSTFLRINTRWFYLDGQVQEGTLKPKRNAPCLCNSGKKFKACCGKS